MFTLLCNKSLEHFHLAKLKNYNYKTIPHFPLPPAPGNRHSTFLQFLFLFSFLKKDYDFIIKIKIY